MSLALLFEGEDAHHEPIWKEHQHQHSEAIDVAFGLPQVFCHLSPSNPSTLVANTPVDTFEFP